MTLTTVEARWSSLLDRLAGALEGSRLPGSQQYERPLVYWMPPSSSLRSSNTGPRVGHCIGQRTAEAVVADNSLSVTAVPLVPGWTRFHWMFADNAFLPGRFCRASTPKQHTEYPSTRIPSYASTERLQLPLAIGQWLVS